MGFIDQFANTEFTKAIAVLLTSMLPVLELRAGIPLGVSLGLGIWPSVAISIVGNLLPIPFIILFVRRVFEWIKRKNQKLGGWVERMEKKAYSKSKYIYKYAAVGLFIFVAIPFPGTGAWTGALIAALFDMRLKTAIPAIVAGVLVAAALVSAATLGVIAMF